MPDVPELLEFATLWSYVPAKYWRNDDTINPNQKQALCDALSYRDAIKYDRPLRHLPSVYDRVAEKCVIEREFDSFFDDSMVLVPVPRSKLSKPGTLWPPKLLAEALRRIGIGSSVATCLSRKEPVHTSSQGSPSERVPAKTHCESMEMKHMVMEPKKILLVDDVITRGSTSLGAACRISEIYPEVEVKAFAPLRPISRLSDFNHMEDPKIGFIELCDDGHGTTIIMN